jgi:hypothetical protein
LKSLTKEIVMRNLKDHPITLAEKLHALESAIELIAAQGKLGDIRPAALRSISQDLSEGKSSGSTS